MDWHEYWTILLQALIAAIVLIFVVGAGMAYISGAIHGKKDDEK